MKIRTDYVTNSSSSSFILIYCKNQKLAELLQKLKEEMEEFEFNINIKDDEVEFIEDDICVEIPNNKDSIITSILQFFTYGEYYEPYDEESEEENIEYLEEYPIALAIYENKKEIMEAMESTMIKNTDIGWGGDDDTRFYRDSYDDNTLQIMLKNIAENNNCDIDDVDEDMFCDYVANETSQSTTTFNYESSTGKITIENEYELL